MKSLFQAGSERSLKPSERLDAVEVPLILDYRNKLDYSVDSMGKQVARMSLSNLAVNGRSEQVQPAVAEYIKPEVMTTVENPSASGFTQGFAQPAQHDWDLAG